MFIEGLQEKDIYLEKYPFRLVENSNSNFEYPPHWHNAVEIIYISKGNFPVKVNYRDMLLNERDILIIPAGDIHCFPVSKSGGLRYFIQFDAARLDGIGIDNVKPFLLNTCLISYKDSGDFHKSIEQQIIQLIDEYGNKHIGFEYILNARIFDIMAVLTRSCYGSIPNETGILAGQKIPSLEKLNKAFEYIHLHYRNEISLRDISRFSGFSEYHFSRIFKATFEKNFHQYLKEYRIKKAELLLSDSSYSITEAAYMSGFNSLSTFNRAFRDVKGCTPTQYRKLFTVPGI